MIWKLVCVGQMSTLIWFNPSSLCAFIVVVGWLKQPPLLMHHRSRHQQRRLRDRGAIDEARWAVGGDLRH